MVRAATRSTASLRDRCSPRSTSARSTLQTFGICFALAFLACGWLLGRRLRELGKPRDWAYEIVFAALVGGLVGSRVDYLVQNWDKVSDDLLGNIFSGIGLVWFGGLVGGALGVCLWARRRGFLGWGCSTCAPCRSRSATRSGASAASSRATATTATRRTCRGRWPTRTGPFRPTDEVHPTPVYETLAMGVVALRALAPARPLSRPGVLFALYLVFAGIERLLVEFIRRNDDVVARAHPAAADQRGDDRARRGVAGRALRRAEPAAARA